MTLLALDTSMRACSVAISRGDRTHGVCEPMSQGHAEALVPMIVRVLREAALGFADLERVAVTTGPGTFTGVRIGVATARGLGLAAGLPVVGATTLAVMARQVLQEADGGEADHVAIAADARRGQVYFGLFDRAGQLSGEIEVLSPEAAASRIEGMSVIVAGTGAGAVRDAAGRPLPSTHADLQPDARVLAQFASEIDEPPVPLTPLYLRPPDAKPQHGKSLPWHY